MDKNLNLKGIVNNEVCKKIAAEINEQTFGLLDEKHPASMSPTDLSYVLSSCSGYIQDKLELSICVQKIGEWYRAGTGKSEKEWEVLLKDANALSSNYKRNSLD